MKKLAFLLFLALPSWGAVVVDSEMPSNAGVSSAVGANTYSFSFSNSAGTLLICGVVLAGNDTNSTVTSVTYDSVSMGSVDISTRSCSGSAPGFGYVGLYHLLNPSTGSKTLTVNSQNNSASIIVGCMSVTGNDGTTPIKQTAAAICPGTLSDPTTVSVVGTTSGNLIVDLAGNGDSMTSRTQTLSWTVQGGCCYMSAADSSRASGTGGTVTFSHTVGGADNWGDVAVEIAAASGGSTTTTPPQHGLSIKGGKMNIQGGKVSIQ